jgi:FkbM family methyltransferase
MVIPALDGSWQDERVGLRQLRYTVGTMRRDVARTAFYRRFVKPGDLAFDIGAHTGDRTRLLLRAGARVVAVEPHPALSAKLQRTFEAEPDVVIVAEAVGTEAGSAELRWPAGGLPMASMAEEWVERVQSSGRFRVAWEEHAVVSVTTLDELIEGHGLPTFCKIDVEGYEEQVLAGLTHPIASLSIEFTPEFLDSTERSLARLAELGEYRFAYSVGESLKLNGGGWLTQEQALSQLRELDAMSFGDVYARRSG